MRFITFLFVVLVIAMSCGEYERSRAKRESNRRDRSERTEERSDDDRATSKKRSNRRVSDDAIVNTYTFDVGKETYSIDLALEEDVVKYFEDEPKVYTYRGDRLPDDWQIDYYNMFIDNRKDEGVFDDILDELQDLKRNMSNDELVQFVVAFVQGGMDYDWNSYYSVSDKLNYPYETLFAKKGVCSDKSLVLGKLLTMMDYEVVFLTFENANHMAVGLKVPSGYGNLGTDYAFVESTNYSNIGRVPENFVGGVKIEEAPEIIPIKNAGRKTFNAIRDLKDDEDRLRDKYGDEYLQASAKERAILEEMYELKSDIDELTRKFEKLNCEGRVSSSKLKACNKFQHRINKKVDAYNEKVAEYNALNQPET